MIFSDPNNNMNPGVLKMDRRRFLRLGTFAGIALLSPSSLFASTFSQPSKERRICLYNTNTKEHLELAYFAHGKYLDDPLQQISHILRDHRTGEITPIDTRLLDLLHVISLKIQAKSPFHVVSGYRSPSTNTMLRKKNKKVAKNSLHMQGKAVDVRLPGFKTRSLRRIAMQMKSGGVGYYPGRKFIHLDVGQIRYW